MSNKDIQKSLISIVGMEISDESDTTALEDDNKSEAVSEFTLRAANKKFFSGSFEIPNISDTAKAVKRRGVPKGTKRVKKQLPVAAVRPQRQRRPVVIFDHMELPIVQRQPYATKPKLMEVIRKRRYKLVNVNNIDARVMENSNVTEKLPAVESDSAAAEIHENENLKKLVELHKLEERYLCSLFESSGGSETNGTSESVTQNVENKVITEVVDGNISEESIKENVMPAKNGVSIFTKLNAMDKVKVPQKRGPKPRKAELSAPSLTKAARKANGDDAPSTPLSSTPLSMAAVNNDATPPAGILRKPDSPFRLGVRRVHFDLFTTETNDNGNNRTNGDIVDNNNNSNNNSALRQLQRSASFSPSRIFIKSSPKSPIWSHFSHSFSRTTTTVVPNASGTGGARSSAMSSALSKRRAATAASASVVSMAELTAMISGGGESAENELTHEITTKNSGVEHNDDESTSAPAMKRFASAAGVGESCANSHSTIATSSTSNTAAIMEMEVDEALPPVSPPRSSSSSAESSSSSQLTKTTTTTIEQVTATSSESSSVGECGPSTTISKTAIDNADDNIVDTNDGDVAREVVKKLREFGAFFTAVRLGDWTPEASRETLNLVAKMVLRVNEQNNNGNVD